MPTPTTVAATDAAGNAIRIRADQNPDASLAMRSSLEVNGAPNGTGNPVFVAAAPVPTQSSGGAANSLVLKASPGTLYALQANPLETGWLMLFDAVAPPADGAVSPRKSWFYSSVNQETFDRVFDPPLAMASGAVLCFSTTGPLQKTTPAQGMAQLSGEIV